MAKFNSISLAISGAIVAALCMLLLSIANVLGIYQGAVEMMQGWHMFYTPDVLGTITGMIEAAIITFVALYVFGAIYNSLAK